MRRILPLMLFSFSLHAAPYKMVVITDPETRARADEFSTYIKNLAPFNKMGDQLVVEVTEMSADDMDCSNDKPDAPRIISCNHSKLVQRKSQLGGHVAMAFTSRGTGGAGGSIAVASKDYPLSTMLHELLHTYGLDDEYNYSESERGVYCQPPRPGPNTALIKPQDPYADKADALGRHGSAIPWQGDIDEPTPVTHGTSLGTTEEPARKDSAGLYEGGNCTGTTGMDKKVYRPYMGSIMRQLNNDHLYPLYERRVIASIESAIGKPLNLNVQTSTVSTGPQPSKPDVKCDPEQMSSALKGQQSSNALVEDMNHIYQHLMNPTAPHIEGKDGH